MAPRLSNTIQLVAVLAVRLKTSASSLALNVLQGPLALFSLLDDVGKLSEAEVESSCKGNSIPSWSFSIAFFLASLTISTSTSWPV